MPIPTADYHRSPARRRNVTVAARKRRVVAVESQGRGNADGNVLPARCDCPWCFPPAVVAAAFSVTDSKSRKLIVATAAGGPARRTRGTEGDGDSRARAQRGAGAGRGGGGETEEGREEVEGGVGNGREGFGGAEVKAETEGERAEAASEGVVGESRKGASGESPDSPAVELAVRILKCYKREISPWIPASCRFIPTCSEYSVMALRKYGLLRGGILTAWRLLRCNPFGPSGYDPPRWFG
ncbi:unnamed protein product [Closterium sp. NIES-54]